MTGHRVPRKGGWDCHGLPVELEVEKELGISSKAEIEEYGIAEFNQRCRESVFRYVEDWNKLTERIGFWIDLDDPYVTMENDYIESVWWALRQIWDDGRLYEGHKVVPYCPRCGTALSSHEVAQGYHDVEDPSVYVKLPIREPAPSDQIPESPLEPGDQLLVWTTTPWTLITNAAVAAGPEIEYVRAGAASGRGLRARPRPGRDGARRGAPRCSPTSPARRWPAPPTSRPSTTSPTTARAATPSCSPTSSRTDEGTGLVHTAIAFGEDDFRLGEQYGITLQNPVTLEGTFDERITDFAGPLRQGGRPRHRRGARRRAGSCCAPRPTCTPTRTAGAATPRSSTTRSRAGTSRRARSRTGCSPRTRRSAGTPSTSSTAASASGSRTTSTGRSRATATGARRCRSGSATQDDCEQRFCAGSRRRPARARRRGPRRPAPPLHRRGRARLRARRAATARCAGSRR